jgi:hypothetical protein
LEEKLIPLLLRLIGPDRLQVDENSEALKISNMMKGGGSGHRQAISPGRAAAGRSYFSIAHTGWKSG